MNFSNRTQDSTIQVFQGGSTQRAVTFSPEKAIFLSGTAERVLTWHRLLKIPCCYEVIASVISVQDSQDNLCDTILLKDKKGPILQVIRYFSQKMQLEDIQSGQILRCVGYMVAINTMQAVNIRRASDKEITSLKRLCHIGDFTVSGLEESNI